MTRKDYVALAAALQGTRPIRGGAQTFAEREAGLYYWEITRDAIADVLAADNPRFDRSRFVKACEGGK